MRMTESWYVWVNAFVASNGHCIKPVMLKNWCAWVKCTLASSGPLH